MRIALDHISVSSRNRLSGVLVIGSVLLMTAITGRMVESPSYARLAFAICFCTLMVGLGTRAPRAVLYGLIVWLVALGLTRRLLTHGISGPTSVDPLLLVEPLALVVLLFGTRHREALRQRTPLATAVLAFMALVVLGALNPLQGSLFAGLSSIIFFIPILAFWIGRTLTDIVMRRALLIYGLCAIPAALYGLFQLIHGFPSWDTAWIENSGYTALLVGGAVRPFSTFSSAAEFAAFLSASIFVWLLLVRATMRVFAIPVLVLLIVSIFLQSSRGSIISIAASVAIMVGARKGLSLTKSVILGAIILALIPFAVRTFVPASTSGSSAESQLTQHEISGLANPFNPNQSTASAHISLLVGGIRSAFQEPLGYGLSAVTIAGTKFGGTVNGNSEADPSNAAIALGLPGLLVYLVLFVLALSRTYGLAVRTKSPLALTALAILLVVFPQWLDGGQYAVAFLPWLLLGWVDAKTTLLNTPAAVPVGNHSLPEVWTDGHPSEQPLSTWDDQRGPREPATERVVARRLESKPSASLRNEPAPTWWATPRRWNLWTLENLVSRATHQPPERSAYQQRLLYELRSYASSDGRLPLAFDDFVRTEFLTVFEETTG